MDASDPPPTTAADRPHAPAAAQPPPARGAARPLAASSAPADGPIRQALRGLLRLALTVAALFALWWAAVAFLRPPAYAVPSPAAVAAVFAERWPFLLQNAAVTAAEIVLGLAAGVIAGTATAIVLASVRPVRRVLLPVVLLTQALPVFAIAPLLVVWLGYGIASKVVMATLIIYFPIASAYADGMLRADRGLVDLARLHGASPLMVLWTIRMPAGLPHLLAGLKVAATVAPIGAVVGEWVGASAGLGFIMLRANARLETDLLFAALFLLALMVLALRAAIDRLADRAAPWAGESG